MGRRTETVLRLIDRLVDAERLERRGEKVTLADRQINSVAVEPRLTDLLLLPSRVRNQASCLV